MDATLKSCREFGKILASDAPTPGGGGAAALVGALGMALGNMVGSLTVGKKKYADVEEEIKALNERSDKLRETLMDLVLKDAEGFEPLAKAYGIPKDDPDRDRILEEATVAACDVPMTIMEKCCEAIEIIKTYAEKGSRLAVSDAGCGAACAKAALFSASLNIYINTKSLKDRDMAAQLNAKADGMLSKYGDMADSIFNEVLKGFKEG